VLRKVSSSCSTCDTCRVTLVIGQESGNDRIVIVTHLNSLKSVNTITCSQRLCFPVVQFLPNFLNVLYAWNIYQWTLNNQQSLVLILIKLESHRWCNYQRNCLDPILERRSDQSKNYKIRIVVSSLDIVGE
jgi:hypothetical protein